MAKVRIEKDKLYNIQPTKGESYHDCDFVFGEYKLSAVEDQYFQIPNDDTWWDSEGFDITKI